jgi:carbon-monoxide dehydrogenase medium subunit
MKPPAFAYHAPSTLREALDVVGQYGDEARVLAGGQSLIPMMSLRLVRPANLVDLRRVSSLRGIARRPGGLRIAAMTAQRELEESDEVRRYCPLLAEATSHIGYLEIRNRGTVGGNVANADPASELPAALLALGASIRLEGNRGARTVPADAFFVDAYTTVVAADEILTFIDVPDDPDATGAAFVEYTRRHGEFALVGVAALATLSAEGILDRGRKVVRARIALSGAGPAPRRCVKAEACFDGAYPDAATLNAAAETAAEEVDPDDDIHASATYRRQLVRVLVTRAMTLAVERASHKDTRVD